MSTYTDGEHAVSFDRRRLADQVYEHLRGRILSGEVPAGAHLSVPRIADELGLSRSPVREAVQRLVVEGLGVEQVHRGAEVARIGPDELDELIDLRLLVEGYAAGRAAQGSDRADLVARLEASLATHAEAIANRDRAAIVAADMAFHLALAQAAGAATARVVLPLLGRAQLMMAAGDLSRWPQLARIEHAAVLAAVRTGDATAAEAAARDHLARIRERHHALRDGDAVTPG